MKAVHSNSKVSRSKSVVIAFLTLPVTNNFLPLLFNNCLCLKSDRFEFYLLLLLLFGLILCRHAAQQHGVLASADRSHAAELRRHLVVQRGPEESGRARGRAAVQELRQQQEQLDQQRPHSARVPKRRALLLLRHCVLQCRGWPGERLLLHQQQLHGVRHRIGSRGVWLHTAGEWIMPSHFDYKLSVLAL